MFLFILCSIHWKNKLSGKKPKSKKTRTTLCEGTIILGHKISKHIQLVSNTKKNPKHHFEFYLYSHSKITT